ncbi:MAG: glycosyltransferase, partial [Chryseolinea sp.]
LFHVVGYEKNMGLGEALNYGMNFVHTPYVARMDGDDIAVPERFERQMTFMERHPEIDVLGTCIGEFDDDPGKIIRSRRVPQDQEKIIEKASLTNPMNHMTVVFKKDKVLQAGGYRHAPYFEDYDLWVRMLNMGMKFHNLQEDLVLARIGNDMVGKRHGLKYSGYEFNHFKNMHKYGFISIFALWKAIALRMPLRLLPKSILSLLYRIVLRK